MTLSAYKTNLIFRGLEAREKQPWQSDGFSPIVAAVIQSVENRLRETVTDLLPCDLAETTHVFLRDQRPALYAKKEFDIESDEDESSLVVVRGSDPSELLWDDEYQKLVMALSFHVLNSVGTKIPDDLRFLANYASHGLRQDPVRQLLYAAICSHGKGDAAQFRRYRNAFFGVNVQEDVPRVMVAALFFALEPVIDQLLRAVNFSVQNGEGPASFMNRVMELCEPRRRTSHDLRRLFQRVPDVFEDWRQDLEETVRYVGEPVSVNPEFLRSLFSSFSQSRNAPKSVTNAQVSLFFGGQLSGAAGDRRIKRCCDEWKDQLKRLDLPKQLPIDFAKV